ncbi:flagellar motor switch protein FliN [Nocardioides sp. Leaf307]|uniref:flagellar motor switch protein FliN n=1 Tax=Nocardioides sp. Leaf307 TaxID=1736331 RepID=UPI000702E02B|nr:flagellar motor switch protein FliN [Nocardioides sp. Leaf307]KQQ39743.1 flagellar motor switch protein FliN [Nocardioides sp. Leaf307]
MTSTLPAGGSPADALALAAAEACATVLPASEPLSAGDPQPGTEHVVGVFAGAAVADLSGPAGGRVSVLVGEELVSALQASPLGGLDLGAAVQPALDAAAAALGATAQAARSVDLELLVPELTGPSGGGFTAVPLLGAGIVAALLVPDTTLAAALAAQAAQSAQASQAGQAGQGSPAGGPAATTVDPFGQPVAGRPLPATGQADNVRSIADGRRGIEMLHGVEMEVTVELGRTRMPVRDLLALAPGAVLALDRAAGSPADLLVNGRLIARGEVVVVDEDFGLRVTEILDQGAVG